ncbi:hypothetical protein FHG87_007416 [Trinorchestia longiramus]|nr:hypothetical protein FHG87_007416 [Trinorchestia longiramus]
MAGFRTRTQSFCTSRDPIQNTGRIPLDYGGGGQLINSHLFLKIQVELKTALVYSVSQSGPYRPPGGVKEMQGGGRRVRLEWGANITV